MSGSNQFGETFSVARFGVKKLLMQAGGWNVAQAHEDRMIHPAIFFYVMDHQTKWVWMCSVPRERFHSDARALVDYKVEAAAAGAARIIKLVAGGSALAEWEEQLAKLLIAYIVKTSTYALSAQGQEAPHFLIMHYGMAEIIRPAALKGSDQHVMPAQTIMSWFDQMLAHDKQHNPDWVCG
jgi:hypothetical protein